ncbi:transmembrane protein 41A-like [Cryptotermes secundus]|uniref:transmembrane protein 41A-like n=1 Tax=Cryptotermes secundus TaxID=105785 RepID=UPI001454DA94|nr:transmembrane protein 41A-like [Cryptotermes secundus]
MHMHWIVFMSCAQASKFIKSFRSVFWSRSNNLIYLTLKAWTCDSNQTSCTMGHILYLVPVWTLATAWLYLLSRLAPALDAEDAPDLHFPHTVQDLQHLTKILKLYKDRNWIYVLVLFCSAYIYKQTFIIPGSALLNVLGGALFGIYVGFPLACLLSGIGASCCYLWSYWLGKDLLEYYIPDKMKILQEKVTRNQHRQLYYLMFLRMFPMSPNWLIKLS